MKPEENIYYIVLGFLIVGVCCFFIGFSFKETVYYCENSLSSDRNTTPFKMATGIYFPSEDSFYVYVGNRTYAEIMETCSHEFLHHKYNINHWCSCES